MASLDKTSVRDEVSRLKADFDRLGSEGKLSSESQAIMNSLFMIVELILAIFLERSTKKDSGNSSKPSSQTLKDESALRTCSKSFLISYFSQKSCKIYKLRRNVAKSEEDGNGDE
ncbi:hypothetical protein [Nitrosomonas mobilis]|uniref:Uncharacterized protein n=1 Tax=Nitrosomonas mobilis TaxID=51642 RepID=A0A1G5SHZ7_9PROT|nr:hypothetical protein [Nitrosomonas mobilis]SCZ86748.1 hypothetical protein NSMM_710012 [Nitrosomonas mobilis]